MSAPPTSAACEATSAFAGRPTRVRVLIVEREQGVCERLAAVVRADPGLELLSAGADIGDLPPAAGAEVALIGSGLDGAGSAEAISQLHAAAPGIRCIALSAGEDVAELVDMLAAGAVACLAKSAAGEAFAEAIHRLDARQVQLDRDVAAPLFSRLAERFPRMDIPQGVEDPAVRVQEVIDERQYEMVFQPVVSLHGGDILGMEALARFSAEPRRPPDVWLREAEAAGVGRALEEALLRAALAGAQHLPPSAFMTVNLSPEAAMSGMLDRTVPASLLPRVVVEITNHQQVSDHGALAESLAAARSAGLRVAVDDSGQSLATLHEVLRLAPDFIKLNRALVRDIDRDPTRRALAFALHSVAAQIGASVIAEGIETTAELQALRSLGVAYGQGYLIGRPESLPQAGSTVALPEGSAVVPARPPVVLPGRAVRTFRDASRAAFGLLERELPGSGIIAAQLDHRARRYRVITASDGLAGSVEPGFNLPLEQSLCAHMASGRGPRVCADAAIDGVYGALELQRHLGIASYVAVPLELEGSGRLGSLCAIAPDPDRYEEGTLEMLQAVAVVLMRALKDEVAELSGVSAAERLRRLSSEDALTGALNRLSFLETLDAEARGKTSRYPRKFAAHVEVEGISGVRDQYGRAVGELVVKDLADALVGAARAGDSAGRLGDAEFGVVLVNRDAPEQAAYHCELVGQRLRETFAKRGVVVKARAGLVPLDGTPGPDALAGAQAAAKAIT